MNDNTCASCKTTYPSDVLTCCDDCDAILCAYCAQTITSEDVVCPDCYEVQVRLTKAEERHEAIARAKGATA